MLLSIIGVRLLNGLIEREKFLEKYAEASGRDVNMEVVKFWQVFSNVKMAAISLTGHQRYVSGASAKNVLAVLPILLSKLHQDLVELLDF